MTPQEKTFLIQYLEQTRDRLLTFAKSLTPAQRAHHATEEEWSPEHLFEHITVVENFAFANVKRAIENTTPDESRRGKGDHKDKIILESLPGRAIKVLAPEGFTPTHRWPGFDQLLAEFSATRARTIDFAMTTTADLRVYFAPHPFLKDLDVYQWLLLMGSHCERHVRQAEEVVHSFAAATI